MSPQPPPGTPLSPAMPPLDRAAYLKAMHEKMEAMLGQVADAVVILLASITFLPAQPPEQKP